MEILSRVVTIRIQDFFCPSIEVFLYPSMAASSAHFCGAPDMLLCGGLCMSFLPSLAPKWKSFASSRWRILLEGSEGSYIKCQPSPHPRTELFGCCVFIVG